MVPHQVTFDITEGEGTVMKVTVVTMTLVTVTVVTVTAVTVTVMTECNDIG